MEFARVTTRKSLLNLTPLIDIIFLLIVFFMLTSNFALNQIIDVSVTAVDDAPTKNKKTTLVISLENNLQAKIEGETISISGLIPHVESKLGEYDDVLILSNKSVSVQTVVTAMDSIRLAGGNQISLAEHPSSTKKNRGDAP